MLRRIKKGTSKQIGHVYFHMCTYSENVSYFHY